MRCDAMRAAKTISPADHNACRATGRPYDNRPGVAAGARPIRSIRASPRPLRYGTLLYCTNATVRYANLPRSGPCSPRLAPHVAPPISPTVLYRTLQGTVPSTSPPPSALRPPPSHALVLATVSSPTTIRHTAAAS